MTSQPIGPRVTGARPDELRSRFRGRVISPADPGYNAARIVFARRYEDAPSVIAFPVDTADVVTAVRHAREHGLWLVPRGGGHSFAGFSTGEDALVLDLSEMRTVQLDRERMVATVDAGSRIVDVYDALAREGATISAGECVHVGIAGLTLGGGLGFLSRKYGLTCDELLDAELVTADGETIVAGPDANEDLYWACRGGGGGNFGIVTKFRFRARPAERVTRFRLRWTWPAAPAAFAAWQTWAPTGPDELFAVLRLETTPPGEGAMPRLTIAGCYLGTPDRFAVLQSQLVEAVGSPASEAVVEEQEWATAIRAALESPEDRLYAGCGEIADFGLATKSAYVREPLPDTAIETTVAWLERRQREPSLNRPAPEFRPGVILLEPYGGAVGRVPREATAFVHRDERFLMLFEARWHLDHPEPARHEDWLHGWYEEMLPHCSGAAYQNYPDRELKNWPEAYYGDNLARLEQVKSRYDPDRFFRFEQGLTPARR